MSSSDRVIQSRRVLVLAATAIAWAASLPAQTPVAVSPGAAGAPTDLGTSCPTFSWSGVAESAGYELVLYRVGTDGSLLLASQTQVPGDARSWTPPAPACPRPGSEYAWAVRATTADGESSWSEPLLFTTPGTPTADQVRRALETLRRYRQGALAAGSGAVEPTGDPVVRPLPRMESTARSATVAPPPGAAQPERPLTGTTVGSEPSPSDVVAPGNYSLVLEADVALGGAIFREGYPFLHNDGGAAFGNVGLGLLAMVSLTPGDPDASSGLENTALGGRALRDTTSGSQNTAVGFDALRETTTGGVNAAVGSRALRNNTTGFSNTAVGDRAARSNSAGNYNTAVGRAALYSNASGDHNTAVGYRALVDSTVGHNTAVGSLALTANTAGNLNTAVGGESLLSNTTGSRNTAVGEDAMRRVTTGSFNVAIGQNAGDDWVTGSNNIAIGQGVYGDSSDSGVIRLGSSLSQTTTYIAGIYGATVSGGSQVFVNGFGQLGTLTSSARFKQDVHDVDGIGERLRDLRPVSFRYKDEIVGLEGEANPLEYGLIAEEVAEVFPELVIYDEEGEPFSVRYHLLAPLLLAELQRQDRDRETEVAELRGQLADLRRRLDAVSDQAGGGDHPTSDF